MRGSVSSYETKAGRRWRIQYDAPPGPNGERRRTTRRGFKRQRDAEDALLEAVGAVRDRTHVDPSTITVGEYLKTWVSGARVRKTTRARYRQSVDNHLAPHIGGIRLQQLTADHLDACYRTLEESGGRKGTGLAAKTIRNAHGVMFTALKDAVARGHVVRNVAELARPPRKSEPELHCWTADQLRTFLAYVAEDRLYAYWLLLATTGLRRGEGLGLRWVDIDLDEGRLTVARELTVADGVPHYDEPKTKRGRRTIALDPATVAALGTHRKVQLEERFALGAGYEDSGLVFCWPDGRLIHPHRPTKWLGKLAADLGLPHIGPHGLRHSYATIALRNGVPVKVVSERLGHANVTVTLAVYAHVLPGDDAEAANKVAGIILGA